MELLEMSDKIKHYNPLSEGYCGGKSSLPPPKRVNNIFPEPIYITLYNEISELISELIISQISKGIHDDTDYEQKNFENFLNNDCHKMSMMKYRIQQKIKYLNEF